jgi:hypothetical protein
MVDPDVVGTDRSDVIAGRGSTRTGWTNSAGNQLMGSCSPERWDVTPGHDRPVPDDDTGSSRWSTRHGR